MQLYCVVFVNSPQSGAFTKVRTVKLITNSNVFFATHTCNENDF